MTDTHSELALDRQRATCARFGIVPSFLDLDARIGIARTDGAVLWPLNGLRHPVHGDMCGWYLWAGEAFPVEPGAFAPLCYRHVLESDDPCVPYLAVPAGYRFLIAPDYEDVWFDPTLLDIQFPA